jgi:hypothetical protein
MRQLLDLARENAGLKHELLRIREEVQAVARYLAAASGKGKEDGMPRIIQLAPDGGGRYIAVDRDGQVWRGETKRSEPDGAEFIAWMPLPSEFPRGTS